MDMNDKAGQPSMEEILASIRRIIAEEPVESLTADASPPSQARGGESAIEEGADFELPSMFRATGPAPAEKPALFGRLTDAIRNASPSGESPPQPSAEPVVQPFVTSTLTEASGGSNGGLSSLKTVRAEPQSEPAADPYMAAAFPMPQATGQDNVKRVMAPFKDTRFSGMSAPTGAPAPVVTAAPQPQPIDYSAAASFAPRVERPAAPAPSPAPVIIPQAAAPTFTPPPLSPPPSLGPPPPPTEPGRAPTQPDGTAGGGSIEDTTAELLRPMLRAWLSENMPRMVEKALHIEVAESVKIGKKPGPL